MPKRRRTEAEPELEDVHNLDDSSVTVVDPGETMTVDPVETMVEESPPAVVVTRCERLWFGDGNVILQAEDVQFKVYQAILAQRSPVLAEAFGAVQPGGENNVDGCPVIPLEGDSAEDVKHMLLALYGDPEYTNVRQAAPFSVIAAMIRMGKKYEIDYLRDEGLMRLKLEFPEKLDDFDKIPKSFPRAHIRCGNADEQGDMELEAINLAHECGIKTILPALYFQVIQKMPRLLHGGVQVPTDIVFKLVAGRDRLTSARSTKVYRWVYEVGDTTGCVAKKKCSTISHFLLKRLFKAPLESVSIIMLPWNAFTKELRVPQGTSGPDDLCGYCHGYAKAAHRDGRKAVWTALPTYFGLPGWEHLEDFEPEPQDEEEDDIEDDG